MGSGIEWRRDNISLKKVLGSGSELCGVRVWRAGPFSKHTLELRFNRQIFMIFIVDYFCKKGFSKIKNFNFVDNPFHTSCTLRAFNLAHNFIRIADLT
jgi:hypothetical protein